ncbi:MAG: GAF domain-containing protein, partial [Leptospiraceae bacterium]|nr:GAF domain-containing protein [Leptospiraceae bacterium]
GLWNEKVIAGKERTGNGFATHYLKILLPEKEQGLSFYIQAPGTAFELYANGELVCKEGKVGKSLEESEAYVSWEDCPLEDYSSEIHLLYIISNFHDNKGGPWDKIRLGAVGEVEEYKEKRIVFRSFINGALSILGLYYIALFLFRRKEKSALYFGVFCIFLTLWGFSIEDRKLLNLFPFWIVHKIEFFSFYYAPLFFLLFVHSIFPDDFHKIVKNAFGLLFFIMGFTVLFFPIQIYTSLVIVTQIGVLLFLLYTIVLLFIFVKRKRDGSVLFLLGMLPFTFAIINDMLVGERIIDGVFLANYAFLGFVFIQSIILSKRFTRAFILSEEQAVSLEKSNKEIQELKTGLELKVEERTKELIETKQEIELLNEFTKLINTIPDLRDIFTEISKYVHERFSIEMTWLSLPSEDLKTLDSFKIYSYHKLSEENYQKLMKMKVPLSLEGGIGYKAFKKKRSIYSPQIYKSRWKIDKEVIELSSLKSFLIVPLIVNSESIGVMLFSNISREFSLSESDIQNIEFFCDQIAGVVHNSRLKREAEKSRLIAEQEKAIAEKSKKEISDLNDLFIKFNEKKNLDEVAEELKSFLSKNYKLKYFFLYIKNNKDNTLDLKNAFHPEKVTEEEHKTLFNNRIPLDSSISIHAIACNKKRYFYVKNVKKYPPTDEVEASNQRILNMRSILIVPLVIQDEVIGTISFSNFSEDSLDVKKEEILRISTFCQNIATVMQTFNLMNEIQNEKEKSEKLLLNILPRNIAEELKQTNQVKPVYFHSVSVLFTDFKGFTKIAEKLTPEELVNELDACFSQYDKISERYNLEKLKTIGDSYMCVGGLPIQNNTHHIDVCLAALEIQDFMNQMKSIRESLGIPYWELRLGIHSGPVMAGIVGEKKFQYDIWSDTVNTASRMESSGEPGKINISGATYEIVKEFFECEYRGKVEAKNKGDLDMYFLFRLKEDYSKDENGRVPNEKLMELYRGM